MWLPIVVIAVMAAVFIRYALEHKRAQSDDFEDFCADVRAVALIDQLGDDVERHVFPREVTR